MKHILVTGGTGTLGQLVAPRLRAAGTRIRILSRHAHERADGIEYLTGDLLEDEGVAAAVEGVDTILHLAGGPKGDDIATRHLVEAAARTGTVRHLVHISVIGAERMPLGYFKAKRGAEEAVMESGLPWTILRAAQFHELVLKVVGKMTALPIVPIPGGLRFQSVAAEDVAERLVELTLGAPVGFVPDLAGPEMYDMREIVRAYLDATGKHRLLMPMRLPGKVGRAYRAGDNLALEGIDHGTQTWEDFLAERLGTTAAAAA